MRTSDDWQVGRRVSGLIRRTVGAKRRTTEKIMMNEVNEKSSGEPLQPVVLRAGCTEPLSPDRSAERPVCQTCRHFNTGGCYCTFCELDGYMRHHSDTCDQWQRKG